MTSENGYVWIMATYGLAMPTDFSWWSATELPESDCSVREWVRGFENQFVAVVIHSVEDKVPTILKKVFIHFHLCVTMQKFL